MERYAVYFLPAPDDPLWKFGSSVLGYDSYTCETVSSPGLGGAITEEDLAAWTQTPRRYGFHATLKAPFALAGDRTEKDLIEGVHALCDGRSPFSLGLLKISELGPFLALTPEDTPSALSKLEADCVQMLERFRAPLSEQDLSRRLKSPLTDRQRQYLAEYGYPYVLDQFRFHMTLSGALDDDDRATFRSALEVAYREIAAPVMIDAITVLGQAERTAPFQVIERVTFAETR